MYRVVGLKTATHLLSHTRTPTSTYLPTQTAAGIRCQLPVALPPHTLTTNANDGPLPEASAFESGGASGDKEVGAFVHYRELPVKDNLAGGATARLAIRLLRWVEGTPLVGWVNVSVSEVMARVLPSEPQHTHTHRPFTYAPTLTPEPQPQKSHNPPPLANRLTPPPKTPTSKQQVDVPCTPQALVAAGAYLGRMDLALDGFDHPGAHREHLWDIQVGR